MHLLARASFLIAAILLIASCSDTDVPATRPSLISTSAPLAAISATSAVISPQPVSNPFCPTVAPFNLKTGVIVTANGPSDVMITTIRFQFIDTAGRRAPDVIVPMLPVTLPAPGPTLQFGVAQPSTRTFPSLIGIGCGTGTRGNVIIVVETRDDRGRRSSDQVSVAVQ